MTIYTLIIFLIIIIIVAIIIWLVALYPKRYKEKINRALTNGVPVKAVEPSVLFGGIALLTLIVLNIILLVSVNTLRAQNDRTNNDNETNYSVNIDSALIISEFIELETNPGTFQRQVISELEIHDQFSIDTIEILTSEYAEFPYQSDILDDIDTEYATIIQELFDNINENSFIGGDGPDLTVGLKAKLIVSLSSKFANLECEFFQDSNSSITSLTITYIGKDGVVGSKSYDKEFEEVYLKIEELVKRY